MRLPFEKWLSMRFGGRRPVRKRPLLEFAKTVIAGCTISACTIAAEVPNISANRDMPVPLEQCIGDMAARELDSIRSKADIQRKAADGPPPFRVALNDTFATDAERSDIANWIRIRNRCRTRVAMSPRAGNAIEAASLQQMFALSRILQSGVGQLIRALYYQELTYGEFAQKRYEFTREAAELSSAIGDAQLAADVASLGRTLRHLMYLRISWNVYLRRVNARQPRAVHIRGAIFT